MSKWTKRKIRDFAFTASGGTPSTERKDYWLNGTIPWINSGELSKHDVIKKPTTYITQEALENSSAKLFPVGTVVIALTGATTGMSAILDIETSTNQSITGIFPSKEHDSKFLLYTLQHNIDKILLHNVGSAQPHINKEIVDNLEFNYPIVAEQTKIARILSTADAVIEKTQAAIAKYKAIKQGMLQDLFTRGIDLNTGKLRPRYQDAPHLYKESKLGMIPREWDEIPLEELTTQIGDGIHTTPKYSQNTHFYFINGNNLVNGEIQIGSALCVSEEEFEKHFKKLDERTIMYSINGTIGNIAFYKNEQVIIGKSVCYISCKPSVNLDYIYFLLQTFQVSKFYELQLTASTIRNLSLATVRGTPITIPKDEREQNLIAERIKAINTKLQTEQTYLQKMQSLKKGLMEDLLSGKKSLNL